MKNTINDLLTKTASLINEDKYDDALQLLKSEINNPLFSLVEQKNIIDRIKKLENFIKQYNFKIRLNNATKNELIKMFNSDGYSIEVLGALFDKYKNELRTNDFLKLQQVFLDDGISNEMKIVYLQLFKDYEIKHIFNFHNTHINKTFKINLAENFSIESNELLYKVLDQVQALFFKETSKENVAKQVIWAIYYYYFGGFELIKYNYEELTQHVIDFIDNAFNNITPVDKKFLEWINKILSK